MSLRGRFPASPSWRRVYLAYSISSVGDEITSIALLAKVHDLGGSVAGLAGVVVAQALPGLLVAPLAGVWADRGRKKALLLVADFGRVPIMIAIALLDSLPLVIGLAAALATLTAVFRPAEAALEPELLPSQDIARANAIRTGTRQILMLVGPAITGALLLLFGTAVALVVDAATYALSGLVLLALPRGRPPAEATAPGSAGQLREGLAFIWRHPGLRLVFVTQAVLVLLLGMQGPLFFDFTAVVLGGGGETYAVFMSALGGGALVGSLLLARRGSEGSPLRLLMLVLVVDAVALGGFTYGTSVLVCAVFMAGMGLISAAAHIMIRTYLQVVPPPEIRGRVFGAFGGVQGPLHVASLGVPIALSGVVASTWILRGMAVTELLVALAGLLMVSLVATTAATPESTSDDETTPPTGGPT